jgi:REP element-mobilizing transposase RayT
MPRTPRLHLPGATYHITSRTQGRHPYFIPPLHLDLLRIFHQALSGADVRLLAYALMPNHLHLVLQQGVIPLGRVLQPLLRRISLLVHRVHNVDGHVFERRFRDQPVCDSEHLRNAIVYTHLNPIRAGICHQPGQSRVTSHAVYAGHTAESTLCPELSRLIAADVALPLFAAIENGTRLEMQTEYDAYVKWRMETDRRLESGATGTLPASPDTAFGERHWTRHFSAPFRLGANSARVEHAARLARRSPDLRDIALATLAEVAPDLGSDELRSGSRSSRIAAIRRVTIARMLNAGYRGVQIANYLGIDPSCVSRVCAARRIGDLGREAKEFSASGV